MQDYRVDDCATWLNFTGSVF